MKALILQRLKEIELKYDVKILIAVESGSRAWGFASPDSDYDVRFIYVRKEGDYLKLEKTRDVIEWKLDDALINERHEIDHYTFHENSVMDYVFKRESIMFIVGLLKI